VNYGRSGNGQISGHCFGDIFIVQITANRGIDDNIDPFGITGLGQQFFRQCGIIIVGFDRRIVTKIVLGQRQSQANRIPFQDLLDNRIQINGLGNGLAKAPIGCRSRLQIVKGDE
jgi:hypothetical protein